MNIVLLITITFTLALVRGNDRPCLRNHHDDAYNIFVKRHILNKRFDRGSTSDWETYISETGLCNRSRQSFIRGRDRGHVKQICNGSGRPLLRSRKGNLCISHSSILVYDLNVDNNCRVQHLVNTIKKVIVACDVVVNRCLPVHFERYTNQRPDIWARHCRLRRQNNPSFWLDVENQLPDI